MQDIFVYGSFSRQSVLIAVDISEGCSYSRCVLITDESSSRDHGRGVLIAECSYKRCPYNRCFVSNNKEQLGRDHDEGVLITECSYKRCPYNRSLL